MIAEHEGGAMEVEENAIVLHEDKKYYPDADEVELTTRNTKPEPSLSKLVRNTEYGHKISPFHIFFNSPKYPGI